MTATLLPSKCFFCGSEEVDVEDVRTSVPYRVSVKCGECGASGPQTSRPRTAVQKWNSCLPSATDTVTLWLCESERVYLRPHVLYTFMIDPSCRRCKELEEIGERWGENS